jgi:16S rRNA (guanine(966)-N(2))-methyltransferase RsmD
VRLTGGEARGRRIRGPGSLSIRPTSDRVREALFDVLGARVEGCAFLDVCAGSGAVGIEALSRGARHAVFLERDPRALRLIRDNLRTAIWRGTHEIIPGDAGRCLALLAARGARFQVVFLDPPYDAPRIDALIAAIGRLLDPGGVLVVEHRSRGGIDLAAEAGPLRRRRTYRHGDTSLTLLAAVPGEEIA